MDDILKLTDVSVFDYDELIDTLKERNVNFSRVLLSVNSEIAYVRIIPDPITPITPIRGIA